MWYYEGVESESESGKSKAESGQQTVGQSLDWWVELVTGIDRMI